LGAPRGPRVAPVSARGRLGVDFGSSWGRFGVGSGSIHRIFNFSFSFLGRFAVSIQCRYIAFLIFLSSVGSSRGRSFPIFFSVLGRFGVDTGSIQGRSVAFLIFSSRFFNLSFDLESDTGSIQGRSVAFLILFSIFKLFT